MAADFKEKYFIRGNIVQLPKNGVGVSGKEYSRFLVKDKHDLLYTVFAYGDKIEQTKRIKAIEEPVQLFIVYRDNEAQAKREGWLSGFLNQTEKKSFWQHICFNERGEANAREYIQERFKQMTEAGFVRVKHETDKGHYWKWLPKDTCVTHNGVWKHRIDFLMDVLSPKIVSDALKAKFSFNSVVRIDFSKNEYEATLLELANRAAVVLGEKKGDL